MQQWLLVEVNEGFYNHSYGIASNAAMVIGRGEWGTLCCSSQTTLWIVNDVNVITTKINKCLLHQNQTIQTLRMHGTKVANAMTICSDKHVTVTWWELCSYIEIKVILQNPLKSLCISNVMLGMVNIMWTPRHSHPEPHKSCRHRQQFVGSPTLSFEHISPANEPNCWQAVHKPSG